LANFANCASLSEGEHSRTAYIKVISIKQNIRVGKTFNGHEFPHG
jgi:hypothetical protein